MSVKVYCDAGSNLYPAILKEKKADIHVFPMSVTVDDKTYRLYEDDVDVEAFSKEFYERLDPRKKNVRTSLVSPGEYKSAFEKEAKEGNQVICFTLAKGISGTYNAACLAAEEVNNAAGKEVVHVINTATAGFGEGMMALRAYEDVKAGKSFEEVVKNSEDFIFKVRSEFTVDNISYLANTGRVSPLVAKIANILRIKVMLKGSNESTIALTKRVHGRKTSLKNLSSTALEKMVTKDQTVIITHCNCLEDANSVRDDLLAAGVAKVEVYPYDLVTGAHVGPGCVAIFYVGVNRD
ncbi:MAG: DegV family protein [Bacilli bacterium]|nr:DegV family protein [Bacilli bacterium]